MVKVSSLLCKWRSLIRGCWGSGKTICSVGMFCFSFLQTEMLTKYMLTFSAVGSVHQKVLKTSTDRLLMYRLSLVLIVHS